MNDRDGSARCARVPATEFQRQIGTMIHRCVTGNEAITMTNHGRDVVVLVSAAEYARLRLAADYGMATVTRREGEG